MTRNPQYLVLVRHGQSAANIVTQSPTDSLYYEVSGSDSEVRLTDLGRLQARAAGLQLGRLFTPQAPLDEILLSPFLRVKETADEIAAAFGYRPASAVDSRLSKRNYGQFWNLTYKGVELLYPAEFQLYQQQGKLLHRPPGGENYFDVFKRVDNLIDDKISRCRHNLMLVTHSVVMLSFRRRFEALADEEVVRLYEEVALANGQILAYARSGPDREWKPCSVPILDPGMAPLPVASGAP